MLLKKLNFNTFESVENNTQQVLEQHPKVLKIAL